MFYIDKGWNGACNNRMQFIPSNTLHHAAFPLQNIFSPLHNFASISNSRD